MLAGLYLIMFVKDALQEEVGIVVELCGAVWRNFQPEQGEDKYHSVKRLVIFKQQKSRYEDS